MKIIADENIPYVHELFDHFGEVNTLPGRDIRNSDITDADILLVRSVTPVNGALLQGSKVTFVGTCTIGTDHLDIPYFGQNNITFASAPGCNAYGVVQYVLSALAYCKRLDNSQKVGIIGCGNVGSRLYRCLKALGFQCRVYDPFLSVQQIEDLCAWEQIFDCDIICMHAPLTRNGPYPTYHMVDAEVLAALKPGAFILNAGRGAVIDNAALLAHLEKNHDISVVLDVWENEPDILLPLLRRVTLGSPHIAGYSFEGRTNGSLMIFQALAKFLDKEKAFVENIYRQVTRNAYGDPQSIGGKNFREVVLNSYNPEVDSKALLNVAEELPEAFDKLRKHYPKRREFSHYLVPDNIRAEEKLALLAAGFVERDGGNA